MVIISALCFMFVIDLSMAVISSSLKISGKKFSFRGRSIRYILRLPPNTRSNKGRTSWLNSQWFHAILNSIKLLLL